VRTTFAGATSCRRHAFSMTRQSVARPPR